MFRLINGRLSVAVRMGLIACLFVTPVIVALWLFVNQSWQTVTVAESEIKGAVFIRSVWPSLVARDGATYGEDFIALANSFSSGQAAQEFLQASGSTPALLAAGAKLISAVADGSQLTLDSELDSFYTQDAVTVRLPAVLVAINDLQQAEADTSPDRRAGIIIAVNELSSAANAANRSLESAIRSNEDGKTAAVLTTPTSALMTAIANLVAQGRAAESNLVAGQTPPTQMTNTIALTNDVWLASDKELLRLLAARIHQTEENLAINLGLCILLLLAATGLAAGVAAGLTRRIRVQVKTMETLAGDDISVTIPYLDDRNETGRIAAALAVFKDGLVDRARLRDEAAHLHEIAETKLQATEAAFRKASENQTHIVETLSAALSKVAKGDLTVSVDSVSAEYLDLQNDFNSAISNLKDVVTGIISATNLLQTGAQEIAVASNDLSRRTEQQAASLEEASVSLDEMTTAAGRGAENARQAKLAATSAKDSAVNSSSIKSEAVLAMSEIQRSSAQITQIIGVIDEIAFQTNLLALNAGVEAARAGDAGRGFAVVATEVRALAQRSAAAAKEIKELIASSSTNVQRGVRLVTQTGEALTEIITKVTDINSLIVGISSSSEEQSTGLREVNTAVNLMGTVTQKNAAMAEESTAAAANLRDEATRLAGLVSRFQIGRNEQQHSDLEAVRFG